MGPRAEYVQWSLASSSVGYKYTTVDVMSERESESFFLPVTLVFDANSRILGEFTATILETNVRENIG